MSKILKMLAPLAALIALAVVPAMAQATTAQTAAGNLAVGASVQGFSENLEFENSNGAILQCKRNDIIGKVTANGGEHVTGQIETGSFKNAAGGAPCLTDNASGSTADIKTNLQGEGGTEVHWTLQVQQPNAAGEFQVHISGSPIQFTAQLQAPIIGDVGTCDYSTSSVQLHGQQATNILTIDPDQQFTKQAGPESLCGAGNGVLRGSFALTSNNESVTVHMT